MAPQQDRRHLPSQTEVRCAWPVSQPRPSPATQGTNRGGGGRWTRFPIPNPQSPTRSATRSPPTLERTWTMLHVSAAATEPEPEPEPGSPPLPSGVASRPPSRLPPFRYPARTATACETGLAGRRESTWTRAVCMRTLPVVACRWRWDVFAPREEKKEVLQCAANATGPWLRWQDGRQRIGLEAAGPLRSLVASGGLHLSPCLKLTDFSCLRRLPPPPLAPKHSQSKPAFSIAAHLRPGKPAATTTTQARPQAAVEFFQSPPAEQRGPGPGP